MSTDCDSNFFHEDLERLLDHRGLLRDVAEETGADYKRLHEIVKNKTEPRYSLGKDLEDWLSCAGLLALTRQDIAANREVPFVRILRLRELRERAPRKIRRYLLGIEELVGPSLSKASPTREELEKERERERSCQQQARKLIDKSIAQLRADIEELLR